MEYKRDFNAKLIRNLTSGPNLIQILIGPRQVGKTTGIKQVIKELGWQTHIATADSPVPLEHTWLETQISRVRSLTGEQPALLVIDEVQKVSGWSEVIKKFFDEIRSEHKIKIVLLGSASLDLQHGMSDSLLGRFELVRVPHWTFNECAQFFNWNLEEYSRFGGYPGPKDLIGDTQRWQEFMRDAVIEPVLSKDILLIERITNHALFRQTTGAALNYPAQVVSFNKILGNLQEKGNASTIKHYLELLEKTYFLKLIYKYSGGLGAYKSSPKIIPLAPALIHSLNNPNLVLTDSAWRGRVVEACVGAVLTKSKNWEVYYWSSSNYELDFVLKQGTELLGLEVKTGAVSTKSITAFKNSFPKAKVLILEEQLLDDLLRTGDVDLFLARIYG